MKLPLEPRMYLVLREDLAYKYIQGGHALAQYALEHPEEFKEWNNQYLICLSVFNGLALQTLVNSLGSYSIEKLGDHYRTFSKFKMSIFIEPDLKSELPTAICIFDDGKNGVREYLKHLGLASK